jgi:hypothetical protein
MDIAINDLQKKQHHSSPGKFVLIIRGPLSSYQPVPHEFPRIVAKRHVAGPQEAASCAIWHVWSAIWG